MSNQVASKEPESAEKVHQPRTSVLGLLAKYTVLALVSSLGLYAAFLLWNTGLPVGAVITVVAICGIDWLYLTERAVPMKYLLPGTITMAVFAVLPIIYSIYIAFTNYSTGHSLNKEEATATLLRDGYQDFDTFAVTVAKDPAGETVYLLERYNTNFEDVGSFIGTKDGMTPAPAPFEMVLDETLYVDRPAAPVGYTAIPDAEVDKTINKGTAFSVPLTGDDKGTVVLDTSSSAFQRVYIWSYDKEQDAIVSVVCGSVYKNNGMGSYEGTNCDSGKNEKLLPGWMVTVGAKNFLDIVQDKRYSEAMPRVFVWTVVYAFSSVFLTFTCGMLVALLFGAEKLRFRKIYRSLLIIPYAIPGFLSLMVWKGLLQAAPNGTINAIFGTDFPWLTDPNWAKASILLVNTWLGFPYMFLVATGALQAIPSELKEAAQVDGATRWQVFRNVTLPLLLVAVGPLLVGSFSFNFNNFNQIFLLTGGGPAIQNSISTAGATDILISYTYKLSFASGQGNNYGLSAAVSILIFFIVGSLSFWSFRRSKALENMS